MTDVVKSPKPDIRAGVLAGLIAGLVFLVMEMVLVAMTGGSPWGPPRMIAAIGMGEGVLPPPATFDLTIVLVAMVIHFALSALIGLVWALRFGRLGMLPALVVGAVLGLLIYVVNFYGMTAVFPWFAMARGWVAILSHVVFGLVLAAAYPPMRHNRY